MRRWGIVFAAAFVALTTSGCWWTQAGGSARRTGVAPYETHLSTANVAQLQQLWKVTVDEGAKNPVVHKGRIFVAGDFSVTALRTATGAEAWQYDAFDLQEFFALAVANGKVYAPFGYPALSGGIAEFDEVTGTHVTSGSDYYTGAPAVTDTVLATTAVANDAFSDFYAVAHYGDKTGFIADISIPPSFPVSSPMLAGNFLYVSAGTAVKAFPLDSCAPAPGHPDWCAPAWTSDDLGAFAGTPAAVGNNAIAVGLYDGDVAVLDTAGNLLWKGDTGSTGATDPAVAFGKLYVGAADGKVHVFDAAGCGNATCPETSNFNVGAGPIYGQPVIANDVLYIGTNAGTVVAYAAGCVGTCAPLKTITVDSGAGSSFVQVVVDHGTLYAVTTKDTVAAYRTP